MELWGWRTGLVEVENLLHKLIGGEGYSLRGHTADVVERQASVKTLLDPIFLVHILKSLDQSAAMEEKKSYFCATSKYIWEHLCRCK